MKLSALHRREFKRILLIKPSALGDVIHTVPVLAKLRARYPAARIDWLLTPAIAELIRHHPAVSNIIPFERKRYANLRRPWRAISGIGKLVRAVREARYELVIDLHGQFRSAVISLVSGAPVRIGFDRPRRWRRHTSRALTNSAYRHGWTGTREGAWAAYTHRIPLPTLDVHAVDRYLWLGPLLALDDSAPDFHLPLPDPARLEASRLLAEHGLAGRPFALLAPGTRWETKHWHVDGFARVARHLHARGQSVVLVGSADEAKRCQAVANACPTAVDLSGRTSVTVLACLMERAEICVTNDSGPMHLAVALDSPVVSVFGPTDPLWIGPYGRPGAVVRADVKCSPCYLRAMRRCHHAHACMEQVGAEQVMRRIDEMLRGTRARSLAAG